MNNNVDLKIANCRKSKPVNIRIFCISKGFEDQQRMKQEVDLPVFKQTIYVIDKIAM